MNKELAHKIAAELKGLIIGYSAYKVWVQVGPSEMVEVLTLKTERNFMFEYYKNTSSQSPVIVDDYLYGFRLRTKIRYWVESKNGYGMRACSQTLNPKNNRWNQPNKGNYSIVVALRKNHETGLIETVSLGQYSSLEETEKFWTDHFEQLDLTAQNNLKLWLAGKKAAAKMKWVALVPTVDPTPKQQEIIKEKEKSFQQHFAIMVAEELKVIDGGLK